MFNLFKSKKLKCEICFTPLEKRKYHFFDSSYRGLNKNKNKEKLKLCTVCLMKKYKEYLNNFKHKAIIIEPFKPLNAYQFYVFEDMTKYGWKKEQIQLFRNLISGNRDCVKCGQPAPFLLYPPEIYSKDPYKFEIIPNCKGKYLCAVCICKHLENVIRREQIFFDEVWPPMKNDGLATSFEC